MQDPGSLSCCDLSGMFLEVCIRDHAQIQDGLVPLTVALRASTPFVVVNIFNLVQQCLVRSIIACENRLTCLTASIPLTQPEIAWMRQPVQKWWKIEELLPSPGMVDGIRGMSESIHHVRHQLAECPGGRGVLAVPLFIRQRLYKGMKGQAGFLKPLAVGCAVRKHGIRGCRTRDIGAHV